MPLLFLSPLHRSIRQIGLYLEGHTAALALSNGEGHLLSYLRSYAPCPIGELHRVFGTKRSTLTSMIDRLEERRLVVRALDPKDRRSFLLDLTKDGRKAGDRLQVVLEELEASVRARIRKSDLDGFQAVLAAIAETTNVDVRSRRKP
jgi:DNA-binding MarR family transcriptional regulator